MGYSKENLPGILPSPIKINLPPVTRIGSVRMDVGMDAISTSLRAHALPSNHSSRDRGLELKVGTSRTRRGNKKH